MSERQQRPAYPNAEAPLDIAELPDYWDRRRLERGKPNKSVCAAELRRALAHRSEQVAPLRKSLASACPGSSCEGDCAVHEAEPPSAPPADDVRARVTHEQARVAHGRMVHEQASRDVISAYITQQAELERRARNVIDAWSNPGPAPIDFAVRRSNRTRYAIDALTELLGTEQSE